MNWEYFSYSYLERNYDGASAEEKENSVSESRLWKSRNSYPWIKGWIRSFRWIFWWSAGEKQKPARPRSQSQIPSIEPITGVEIVFSLSYPIYNRLSVADTEPPFFAAQRMYLKWLRLRLRLLVVQSRTGSGSDPGSWSYRAELAPAPNPAPGRTEQNWLRLRPQLLVVQSRTGSGSGSWSYRAEPAPAPSTLKA